MAHRDSHFSVGDCTKAQVRCKMKADVDIFVADVTLPVPVLPGSGQHVHQRLGQTVSRTEDARAFGSKKQLMSLMSVILGVDEAAQ